MGKLSFEDTVCILKWENPKIIQGLGHIEWGNQWLLGYPHYGPLRVSMVPHYQKLGAACCLSMFETPSCCGEC